MKGQTTEREPWTLPETASHRISSLSSLESERLAQRPKSPNILRTRERDKVHPIFVLMVRTQHLRQTFRTKGAHFARVITTRQRNTGEI